MERSPAVVVLQVRDRTGVQQHVDDLAMALLYL